MFSGLNAVSPENQRLYSLKVGDLKRYFRRSIQNTHLAKYVGNFGEMERKHFSYSYCLIFSVCFYPWKMNCGHQIFLFH